MKEVGLEEIRTKALSLHQRGIEWHFHIFSPPCTFNSRSEYALILESADETLVHYSDKAEKEVGQELSPLVHGSKVMDRSSSDAGYQASDVIQAMVERVTQLNTKKIEWHHHLLFANCRFNSHKPRWVLMVEDAEHQPIISITDTEPQNDLKQIESHFYVK